MNKLLVALGAGLKQFRMVFAQRTGWLSQGWLGSTRLNYANAIGDGRGNAIVQAVIQWECRAFPEAPIRVMRQVDDEKEAVVNHPMVRLLQRPNPYYSGVLLWMATLADWMATGNAYWLKARSAPGRTVELWWVPSNLIEPDFPDNGRVYISGYKYQPGAGEPIMLAVEDVVHFRYGMDPQNIRKGLSPLASLAREIFTDDEASNWTASLVRNVTPPGVVISPGEDDSEFEDPAAVKQAARDTFGGDNRGDVLVLGRKTQVQAFGYNPQQMDLRVVRRIPEERVTAIFGVPAIVVGMGAGLDRSTFANYAEAREAAYESNIIPTQRLFAADLNTQLLPDFGDPTTQEVDFDLSGVRVLQEDQNALHERAREDWRVGLITLNQGLAMIGQEQISGPEGDVRMIPISGTITPSDELIPLPLEPVAPPTDQPPQDGQQPPTPIRAVASLDIEEAKAPAQFGPSILRIRSRLTQGLTTDMAEFLDDQKARVLSALRAMLKDAISDESFAFEQEAEMLRLMLEPWYQRSLEATVSVTQAALGVSFTIDDPLTRSYLRQSSEKVRNITDTTRNAIRKELAEGQREGESYTQLASRIRQLPAFDRTRAKLVARTELGESTNRATLLSFQASGVVDGVLITDGDEWDEPCAQLNGRTFTLIEAHSIPLLEHPNCTRAFSPITDLRQMRSLNGNGHVKELVGAK